MSFRLFNRVGNNLIFCQVGISSGVPETQNLKPYVYCQIRHALVMYPGVQNKMYNEFSLQCKFMIPILVFEQNCAVTHIR